jgi:hypothetical protein
MRKNELMLSYLDLLSTNMPFRKIDSLGLELAFEPEDKYRNLAALAPCQAEVHCVLHHRTCPDNIDPKTNLEVVYNVCVL